MVRVYLVGFMGSGKSSAGKRIAALLGYDFTDLDALLENDAGISVTEIFSKYGEKWFRKKEREVLHRTANMTDYVIACGGGTPCYFDNMEFMKEAGITCYLEMEASQLASRLRSSGTKRPLIKDIPEAGLTPWIEKKLSERMKFYELADITVNGFSIDYSELAEKLLKYRKDNR
ncbi:MAG: shikimate kinase [Bacteroidales bacterium]|nr:shikimate kinase [Bacteroidales bacterium]